MVGVVSGGPPVGEGRVETKEKGNSLLPSGLVCRVVCSEPGPDGDCDVFKKVCRPQADWDKRDAWGAKMAEEMRLQAWATERVKVEDQVARDSRIYALMEGVRSGKIKGPT